MTDRCISSVSYTHLLRVEGDGGDDREVDLRRRHDGEARVILGRNAALSVSYTHLDVYKRQQYQATVLMVTHDSFAASYTNRVLFIRDGRIFTELRRGDSSRREFFDRIMERCV